MRSKSFAILAPKSRRVKEESGNLRSLLDLVEVFADELTNDRGLASLQLFGFLVECVEVWFV